MPQDTVAYATKEPRTSRLALAAMVISILGALAFFLVIPALAGMLMGVIAKRRIAKDPQRLGGMGLARVAVTTGLCTVCLALLAWTLAIPTIVRSREQQRRSYCAANLGGIAQSMVVYDAESGGMYPSVMFAPYTPALNSPAATATESTPENAIDSYYKPPFPQAGSVTACLWILVLRNSTSPRQFICGSDPYTDKAPAALQAGPNFYNNFQNDRQLSYSFTYPWWGNGEMGTWWSVTNYSWIPLGSDMAPLHGTGTPRRDLVSRSVPDFRSKNSGAHWGEGQNVAFSDCHVEFARRPDIGWMDDNIFTTSGSPSTGPAAYGGIPAGPFPPVLMPSPGEGRNPNWRTEGPFDTVMYPVRNLDTGRL